MPGCRLNPWPLCSHRWQEGAQGTTAQRHRLSGWALGPTTGTPSACGETWRPMAGPPPTPKRWAWRPPSGTAPAAGEAGRTSVRQNSCAFSLAGFPRHSLQNGSLCPILAPFWPWLPFMGGVEAVPPSLATRRKALLPASPAFGAQSWAPVSVEAARIVSWWGRGAAPPPWRKCSETGACLRQLSPAGSEARRAGREGVGSFGWLVSRLASRCASPWSRLRIRP